MLGKPEFMWYNIFMARKMSEKALIANRMNAKFGGRPKGVSRGTLQYKTAVTEYIAKRLADEVVPIVDSLIKEIHQGNVMAFVALADRAFGKPVQGVQAQDEKGNPIVFMPLELINKHALAQQSLQDVKEVVKLDEVQVIDVPNNGSM
jgi:hypothetical protein